MARLMRRMMLALLFQACLFRVPLLAQQPTEIAAAPVPSQILTAKKVFVSNAGGEEVDPRTFGFPDVDTNRTYNQFYTAIKNSGRYEAVSTPADAELVLEVRFTYALTVTGDNSRPSYAPVLKLRILDPKTGALLWAISEAVKTPGGPHFKEKRESAFNKAMTALFDDFGKLASPHGS